MSSEIPLVSRPIPIEEFSDLYTINSHGEVYRIKFSSGTPKSKRDKPLKQYKTTGGVLSVSLSANGKSKKFPVKKLYRQAFGSELKV